MKTTLDKAGRVVIPAEIRRLLGLRAGAGLNILIDEGATRLLRDVPGPKLVRVGGRWSARPTARELPVLNVARLVEEERNRWLR